MADLEIDYHAYPVFNLEPASVHYLDRDFLSQGTDLTISRAPDAPCLRHRGGSWWIDNDSDRNEAIVLLWAPDVGRQEVPRRASYALPDGQIEVQPWKSERYRLLLSVSGSDIEQTRPGRDVPPWGDLTEPGLPGADARITALFRERYRTRIILAAHFREYLVRGFHPPRAQERQITRRCMGFDGTGPVDSALQDAQKAIWGELGHADELPGFLMLRGHLRRDDQGLVPHKECGHERT